MAILAERVERGAAIVAATHDRRFVADVADRVIELDEGWIVRRRPGRSARRSAG